jgi:hypothetical protein
VKVTTAVPETEPAATLTAVGAPGALGPLDESLPHAAKSRPNVAMTDDVTRFIWRIPFQKDLEK